MKICLPEALIARQNLTKFLSVSLACHHSIFHIRHDYQPQIPADVKAYRMNDYQDVSFIHTDKFNKKGITVKQLQFLHWARRYWLAIAVLNLVMIGLGCCVLWDMLPSTFALPAALLSGLFFFCDLWLLYCLIHRLFKGIALLQNKWLTTTIGMTLGAFYNTIYVLIALVSSFLLHSPWYLVYAFYHLVFAGAKHYISHDYRTNPEDPSSWRLLKRTAYFIILSALIFHIIVIFVANHDDLLQSSYTYLVYVTALATFINAGLAVSNILKLRQDNSPRQIATKSINLSSTLFSIFFLQTMMLKEFSDDPLSPNNQLMTILLGSVVFFLLAGLGIFLLIKIKKETARC
ncbi:beta-carotene 15,15'-monooxygenase [Streptococcus suis]|uniref:beta-carotene 15,15'-monooxygenase n=1 Tax=Streptococcus suis TaxID=1307 RepID=UPI0037D16643